jgi:hypothetical protein
MCHDRAGRRRDALLSQLLDEALAEAAACGSHDWPACRARHPDHVKELRHLLHKPPADDVFAAGTVDEAVVRCGGADVTVVSAILGEQASRWASG